MSDQEGDDAIPWHWPEIRARLIRAGYDEPRLADAYRGWVLGQYSTLRQLARPDKSLATLAAGYDNYLDAMRAGARKILRELPRAKKGVRP